MKVCIAGGGRVGRYLAQNLLANRHKVVIIEPVDKGQDRHFGRGDGEQ